MGGVPEAPPAARPRGRPLPRLGRARAAGRRAARRGLPPAARPRRLARAARGLRAALPGAATSREAADALRRRSPPRCASSASSSPARASAAARSEVDRLLTGSQAKALGLVEVLAAEHESARRRAARARAVRRRARRASAPTTRSPACSTPPPAPPATRCWRSPATPRTAPLRPLLVSGRGLRCAPAATPRSLLRGAAAPPPRTRFKLPGVGGRARRPARRRCSSTGAEWMPRAWVELATRLLVEGTTRRAGRHPRAARRGLGLPAAQRAGRPDDRHHRRVGAADARPHAAAGPARPARRSPPTGTSSASRPTCVRGSADYERFVRKHLHLFAPAEDGEVEAGPSHVHPELGPFAPPPVERFGALNARAARPRGRPRRRARALADRHALPRRRAAHPAGAPPPARRRRSRARAERPARAPTSPSASRSRSGVGGGVAFGVLGVATGAPPLLAGLALAPAGLGWAAVRLRARQAAAAARSSRSTPPRAPSPTAYTRARRADAGGRGARSTIEPRAAGYLRCELSQATPEEGRRFAAALDELVERLRRAALPRLAPAGRSRRGALGLLGRVLTRRAAVRRAPAPRARRPRRATRSAPRPSPAPGAGTSARAGSSSPSAATRAGEARAEAASADGGYETLVRDVWV